MSSGDSVVPPDKVPLVASSSCSPRSSMEAPSSDGELQQPPHEMRASAVQDRKKHVLSRLPTSMSLASDSEDEPGLMAAERFTSRGSVLSFDDLKLNTVSGFLHGSLGGKGCSFVLNWETILTCFVLISGHTHSCGHRALQHRTVVRGIAAHGDNGECWRGDWADQWESSD